VILVTSGEDLERALAQTLRTKGVEKIWSLDHSKKESTVDRYLDPQMNALEFVKDVQQIVLEAR
jgi:hypothetical protein